MIDISAQKARLPGTSVAEYALLGACVLIISMAGLVGLGHHISNLLSGLRHDLEVSGQEAGQVAQQMNSRNPIFASAPVAPPTRGNGMSGDTLYVDSSNADQLCGPNFCISAPGFSRSTISTAGSNGSIIASTSDIYSQLAQIMEAQGADPETVALLTRLAQQGHQLGDAESLLHGRTYTRMKKGVNGLKNGVGRFKALAQELTVNIDNYPPEARALLKDASRVIIGIANSYHVSTSVSSAGNNRVKYTQNIYKIKLTHYNSNVICSNGGDDTQCIR